MCFIPFNLLIHIYNNDYLVIVSFGSKDVKYPELNLFVWALLLNRIELAKIFWRIGEHQIMCALFATNILNKLSLYLTDLSENLIESAK